jgi:FtsZ-binding cell division protein ZapB
LIFHQLDDELKKKYNAELSKEKKKFAEQSEALEREKAG